MGTRRRMRPSHLLTFVVALGALCCADRTRAAQPRTQGVIEWRSGASTTPKQSANTIAQALSPMALTNDRHRLVQFHAPVSTAQRAALRTAGIHLLRYVGDNAYFASIDATRNPANDTTTLEPVRCVLPIAPGWKLHEDLAAGIVHDWAVVSAPKSPADERETRVAAYVIFHADVPLDATATAIIAGLGGEVRSRLESINGAVIELPASAINALAAADAVQWIEPPLPKFSALNNDSRARTGASLVQEAPYGLSGAGVSVMVYDSGYGYSAHLDFGGRHTVRDNSGLSDHATHVAGTLGGDGLESGGVYRGMAPGVVMESYGFEQEGGLMEGFLYSDPGDLEDDYLEAIGTYGVDISNNSLGTNTSANGYPCEWEGDYGTTSVLIDTIVRGDGTNPLFSAPFRVIWANGNERQDARCLGIEGFPAPYHSTAPPACAKNHITVGALNSNDDTVTEFTSFGPTDDGRLKPDFAAPGCQSNDDYGVTSCTSGGDYRDMCGTSMAAPAVCGLAALLLEDFREQYPETPDPRNATLKALFAHTAVDIENPGPDYKTGYGSVRIVPTIELLRSGDFFEAVTDQDVSYTAAVIVSPGDTELKVTLAWDDVPGTPNVNPALVNDLDLRVIGPDGTPYFPWTLDPLAPDMLALRTEPDRVNNIEQVYVEDPPPGAYRIEVYGYNVPQGPQPFSLTATPYLVNCASAGTAQLDAPKYACNATATLKVVDCDLNTSDDEIETIIVTIDSPSEPAGELVTLTETAAGSAEFEGSIALRETDADGVLQIAPGDTITLTYDDADDGSGHSAVVTDTALVDCAAPVITSVQTSALTSSSVTLTIQTDERTRMTVRYGTNCPAVDDAVDSLTFKTTHNIHIGGLTEETTYHFVIDVIDEAGNATTADNGGNCYTFTTPQIPDFFTELFSAGDNDLANTALLFVPVGGLEYYVGCTDSLTALPTDPNDGIPLTVSDDGNIEVVLSPGNTVQLYGVAYDRFYVGANGYITFGAGDTEFDESIPEHFQLPRIAPLFDDFDPDDGGTISWQELPNRAVVTWFETPEFGTGGDGKCTFQVEMWFDGRININYLALSASDGLAGLSPGGGASPQFRESDLSLLGQCLFDCNSNGTPDDEDIASGTSADCNANRIPDVCDVMGGASGDCNLNGTPDECEIASGAASDCNSNGIPDTCDLTDDRSLDCNGNSIPDECEIAAGLTSDCNSNGVPDECDIVLGMSTDCNGNSIPDECDVTSGFSLDCNKNNSPDECDVVDGTSGDCNTNGIPDECDTASGATIITDTTPARFGWIEIVGSGTPLNLGDDDHATVTIPFTNAVFSDPVVTIHSNGGVGFGGGTHLPRSNAPIPYPYAFDGGIAVFPFWDNLDSDSGNVYWRIYGTAPNRTLVVQWQDRPHAPGDAVLNGDEATYQVQVFEQPIDDVFAQYLYVDTYFDNWRYDYGKTASVGFQLSGTVGGQWSYNDGVITPGVILSVQTQASASPDINGNQVPDECEPWIDCKGDANCDAFVNFRDIDHFVAGQNDNEWGWRMLFADPLMPGCPFSNLDCNGDGSVNFRDIDAFIARINDSCLGD